MSAPGFYSRGCPCEDCAETVCEVERVEPGWNVQTDSGEVFVSDEEIAELRDKLEGGDIQAARLIAERYSAAYGEGFSAGVELGEARHRCMVGEP